MRLTDEWIEMALADASGIASGVKLGDPAVQAVRVVDLIAENQRLLELVAWLDQRLRDVDEEWKDTISREMFA